jgi:hypothetical protein
MKLEIPSIIISIILICGSLLIAAIFVHHHMKTSVEKKEYSVRVKYNRKGTLEFPDFTLQFLGRRTVSFPEYPRGFLYYDFKIKKGGIEKTVSWSSGTGDLGPEGFEIGDHSFLLELRRSDKLGRLEEDELVIWKESA